MTCSRKSIFLEDMFWLVTRICLQHSPEKWNILGGSEQVITILLGSAQRAIWNRLQSVSYLLVSCMYSPSAASPSPSPSDFQKCLIWISLRVFIFPFLCLKFKPCENPLEKMHCWIVPDSISCQFIFHVAHWLPLLSRGCRLGLFP